MFEKIKDVISKWRTNGKYSLAQLGNSREGGMNISNETNIVEPPVVQISVPEMVNVSSVPTDQQNGGRYPIPPPYGPAGQADSRYPPDGPVSVSTIGSVLSNGGPEFWQRPPPYRPNAPYPPEYVIPGKQPLPQEPRIVHPPPLSGSWEPAQFPETIVVPPTSPTIEQPDYPFSATPHTQLEPGPTIQPQQTSLTMDRIYSPQQQGGGTISAGNPPILPISQENTGPKKITDITPGWGENSV